MKKLQNKIYALVTLYFPDEKVVENMVKLSKQVDKIIFIDNTPDKNNLEIFKDFFSYIYIANEFNAGLSQAFNVGLKSLVFDDDDFIIYFDQDSIIPEKYIEILVKNFLQISQTYSLGCLGAQYIDTNTNKLIAPRFRQKLNDTCYTVSSMITSGLLTKYSVMRTINFWNEQVFLDMADWDICWRMIEKGYLIGLCTEVTLVHTLGKGIKKVLGKEIRINHPVREYYQIRDSIKMFNKNYVPWKYKIRYLIMWFPIPLVYLLLLQNRKLRLVYIFHGFVDGIKRRNGDYCSLHELS